MRLLSCHLLCLHNCWKDYIEKFTANYIHSAAVPWCPLSALIIWWCWNMEMSEACSIFVCTKPGLDLCPTVPRPFQPKWVTMKNATNVSLGENEKQKPLSDLHIIVCVNRRKIEVLCITTTLLKQDKQHVHRSLPVHSENALVECHLRVNSICSAFLPL